MAKFGDRGCVSGKRSTLGTIIISSSRQSIDRQCRERPILGLSKVAVVCGRNAVQRCVPDVWRASSPSSGPV